MQQKPHEESTPVKTVDSKNIRAESKYRHCIRAHDTTEWLHFHFSLSCIGEGNGNPLQCSCLENPRDGGAWWAAVYGVAQSRTRLKRLSSSSVYTSVLLSQFISPSTALPVSRCPFPMCDHFFKPPKNWRKTFRDAKRTHSINFLLDSTVHQPLIRCCCC